MLLIAGAVVVMLVILKYLPVKHATLIEGVFDRKEDSSDFYQKVTAFWFDNQCRECIEKNSENESLYGQCHTSVPAQAIKIIGQRLVKAVVQLFQGLRRALPDREHELCFRILHERSSI